MKESPTSLISKFLQLQSENPTRGDWASNYSNDSRELKINLSFEEIKMMTKAYNVRDQLKSERNIDKQPKNEDNLSHEILVNCDPLSSRLQDNISLDDFPREILVYSQATVISLKGTNIWCIF